MPSLLLSLVLDICASSLIQNGLPSFGSSHRTVHMPSSRPSRPMMARRRRRNPFTEGSTLHSDMTKLSACLQAELTVRLCIFHASEIPRVVVHAVAVFFRMSLMRGSKKGFKLEGMTLKDKKWEDDRRLCRKKRRRHLLYGAPWGQLCALGFTPCFSGHLTLLSRRLGVPRHPTHAKG